MAETNINEGQNQFKLSAEKRRQTKRKHQIQDHLMQRRNLFANQDMRQLVQNQKLQVVKEDINIDIEYEDPRDIKGLDLSKHLKRKKKSRKRCWICRSPTHFKNRYLYIRCFWCHKLGHTEATCHMKMIEYIYHRVKEDGRNAFRKNAFRKNYPI